MTVGFPINPPNAPLVLPDGRCSPEWYKFFLAIQKMIGSGVSSPFDDAAFLASPASALALSSDGAGDALMPPSPPVEAIDPLIPPAAPVVIDDLLQPYRSN